MVVDEFGREIPAPAVVAASSKTLPRTAQAQQHRHSLGRVPHRVAPPPPPPSQQSLKASRRESNPSSPEHPSKTYSQDPLLCEFMWKDSEHDDDETYQHYRQQYCLRYVRSFFNAHLDDSWFRSRYSPAVKILHRQQELHRAAHEATLWWQAQAQQAAEQLIVQARLGGGIKGITPPLPQSHNLHGMAYCLHITQIPSHVTDDQLVTGLKERMNIHDDAKNLLQLYSGSPVFTTNNKHYLERQAIVNCGSDDVRNSLWQSLLGNHLGHNTVDWTLDCSDPYGRLEYDADGKGNAPADGLAIPARKSTVRVSRLAPPFVVVLSAALSATSRIASDKEAAVTLTRALDVKNRIIPQSFETWLCQQPPDLPDSDVLDCAIAYLRRVHLCSFYNSCSIASNVTDILTEIPIHVRLANADEILSDAIRPDDNNSSKDLLVQRLDVSISKALDECPTWIASGGTFLVNEKIDRDAAAIAQAEKTVQTTWLHDHAIVDEDRRARCSFHFCHKLFKDMSFLNKHSLKKHAEFLKAEQAKAHDGFMMAAWDAEEQRPVPEVLVDCGANFGLVPSTVTGVEPDCVDPEPTLWQKEEEKRQRESEQRQRREEARQGRKEDSRPGFVDVDDMKEEKIEVSFDNVVIPDAMPKKKKKRKLL